MRVGIIGAGSIGLLFAGYMSKVFDVTIYTRTREQAIDINQNGILVQAEYEEFLAFVNARWIEEWDGTEELSIIAVKQYQLSPVVEQLNQFKILPKNLLFLQNGMAHLKFLESLSGNNIFVGSVEHGALKVTGRIVKHNGKGITNVAVYQGDLYRLQQLITEMKSIDFPLNLHHDYYEMLMDKLVVNAAINPLTALLHVENGELIRNSYYLKVLNSIFSEISFILNLKTPEKQRNQILKICERTASNRSSMLKDIEAGQKTEIDAILGYLLEEALKQGKRAPRIESLYFLIKGKELDKGVFL